MALPYPHVASLWPEAKFTVDNGLGLVAIRFRRDARKHARTPGGSPGSTTSRSKSRQRVSRPVGVLACVYDDCAGRVGFEPLAPADPPYIAFGHDRPGNHGM